MPIMRRYECPSCSGHFEFMHHPADEPPPRFCPLCGYDTQGAPKETLATPAIRSNASLAVDGVHQAMEEGAAHRAQVAQEVHGMDAAQAADLKITDLRTNIREGDQSYVPVNNPVSQFMQANPGVSGFQAQGSQHAGAVRTGPFPNAGLRAMQGLKASHARAGFSTHDTPALETQREGYQPRT